MKDADVEVAQARLDLALARIERSAVVRTRMPAPAGASGTDVVADATAELAAEVVRLRADNAGLVRALKALEERHAALKERSARAVIRLDSTIARVDDLFAR
jgi:hypothetical protein